jgi:hypothetical protein
MANASLHSNHLRDGSLCPYYMSRDNHLRQSQEQKMGSDAADKT